MKAVVFKEPFKLAVEDVEDPKIEQPGDAVIRITTANICGSDLHPYEGRAPLEAGMVLGHENMGIVEEVGPGVNRVKAGMRVSVPFNLACGTCRNCTDGWTSACLRANPSGQPGAGYGYPQMGPYRGGQAEYLRVPWADFNLLELPPGNEHEQDFTLLSDIFPTGYHGTELAGVEPGRTVAIFGAGPVGLMAALSANIRGAAPDVRGRLPARPAGPGREDGRHPGQPRPGGRRRGDHGRHRRVRRRLRCRGGRLPGPRLRRAGTPGTGPRPTGPGGPGHRQDRGGRRLRALRRGRRDRGAPSTAATTSTTGPPSPRASRIGSGQCPVMRYNRWLRDLIIRGQAPPSQIISHELSLDDAVRGYDQFDKRADGWTKVILHP